MKQQQLFIVLFTAAALLAFVVVEGHELPSVRDFIQPTGFGQPGNQISEKQRELFNEITSIYEEHDNLHDTEKQIFEAIGLSEPSDQQKAELHRVLLSHLDNNERLEMLRDQLREEVEGSNRAASGKQD